MSKYDDLFDEARSEESVFSDKGALDPLAEPETIASRDDQEAALANVLSGVHEGYLPTTVSIYGPPGTGKTTTTRRLCEAFATRNENVAVEYVNLKECRTLFSVANEIHLELTGETKKSYEGLDGVFEGIWEALSEYPEYTVLLLDEIDQIKHDSNYDPNDFFYRLLRGEGKLKRGISLSVWLVSNELLDVDLRLDSRIESTMSGEEVFFPSYDAATLKGVLESPLETAFREGVLSEEVVEYGVMTAANRWGDARKALALFRHAGETANERGAALVSTEDIDANLEAAEREAVTEKLLTLPFQHMLVLSMVTAKVDRETGEIIQPLSTGAVQEHYGLLPEEFQISTRAIRTVLSDLETMGLIESWIESRGRGGRVKQVQTTFNPRWAKDAVEAYVDRHREHIPSIETSDGD